MSGDPSVEVLFQGAKCFWRTRNTVDIMLVVHHEFNVTEIITYEPSFDKEAPRIYLDNNILNGKIDQAEVDEKVRLAKEPILRRHEIPNVEKLRKDIINIAKTDYILNRLLIAEFSPETRTIRVEMQFNFRDFDDAHSSGADISLIACSKPTELELFKSPHYQTLLEGQVDQMLDSLDSEKRNVQLLRRRAREYTDNVDFALTTDERWRIPIIYVKVKNGRPLKKSDSRIWNILTHEIAPEEVTTKVAAALNFPLPSQEVPVVVEAEQPKEQPVKEAPVPAYARPKTQSNSRRVPGQYGGQYGQQPGQAVQGKSLRRIGSQASNSTSGSFARGLSSFGASMKRRLGLSVSTLDTDLTDDAVEESFAETTTVKASKKTAAQAPKAKAPAEPAFINPRGTNISITPKPRSYLIPATPKKVPTPKTSPDRLSMRAGGSQQEQSFFGAQSADTNAQAATTDTTTTITAPAATGEGEAPIETFSNKMEETSEKSGTFSSRVVAGFSAFSSSMKRTFLSSKRTNSVVFAGDPAEEEAGEDDGFNFNFNIKSSLRANLGETTTGTGSDTTESQASPEVTLQQVPFSKSASQEPNLALQYPMVKVLSGLPTPKSMTSGGTPSASSNDFFGGAASLDEFRENESRKQAEQDQLVGGAASGASESKYTVQPDDAPPAAPLQRQASSMGQFFSAISPWGRSTKVSPTAAKGPPTAGLSRGFSSMTLSRGFSSMGFAKSATPAGPAAVEAQ